MVNHPNLLVTIFHIKLRVIPTIMAFLERKFCNLEILKPVLIHQQRKHELYSRSEHSIFFFQKCKLQSIFFRYPESKIIQCSAKVQIENILEKT